VKIREFPEKEDAKLDQAEGEKEEEEGTARSVKGLQMD